MDEAKTLHNFLEDIGLEGRAEYASLGRAEKLPPQERHFLEWGHKKIKAESVLFQRIPEGNSCFPLAYFRRLQDDNPQTIAEAHRLAWNMGRAPLLFLVLPGKIRVHSTFEAPKRDRRTGDLHPEAGLIDILDLTTHTEQARQTVAKYRREELLSGRFWELDASRERFSPRTRVERSLLENLKAIRSRLISEMDPSLDPADRSRIVHALLGRSIFIQYLQDRKDGDGYSAFPKDYLSEFSPGAERFADVLATKKATYELFEALAVKFNGDIFPITSRERDNVTSEHLKTLALFLQGKIDLPRRQLCFWPNYSFDAIPIEFISNMYEEFFHHEKSEASREARKTEGSETSPDAPKAENKDGTYYTPHRLVEFLLDEMLPWEQEGPAKTLKILDPSCGSGVFLVEAYRRLISRWQQANPGAQPKVDDLRKIMQDSLFGIDINPEAVRVAAFSLCLTMCDYLEPRYIWNSVRFPELRDNNLWAEDFFKFVESPPDRARNADLVIGNPPWESSLPESASRFLEKRKRAIGDNQIAQAFLWAAPELCAQDGKVCLVAPSKGLLFNASEPNKAFRKQFLSTYQVDLIVNFSALRRTLFAKGVGPAAPVVFRPAPPGEGHTITYCCPKPWNSAEDSWHYVVSRTDIQPIPLQIALDNPHVWKTAMWGGPRDWELIKKLSSLDNLGARAKKMGWSHGEGFIVGKTKQHKAEWLTGQPYVEADELRRFAMAEKDLPPLTENLFYRTAKENKRIFAGPHILFGQSPKADRGIVAALLEGPAVFRHSILGIAGSKDQEASLGAVCSSLVTDVCLYHAMMTASKWLIERDELEKWEVMALPLPAKVSEGELAVPYSRLQRAATNDQAASVLLKEMEAAYGLDECELSLVKDAVTYELDYFRLGENSEAAKPATEMMLKQYAKTLSQCLSASFGREAADRAFPVIVYMDPEGQCPMLAVDVPLNSSRGGGIEVRHASDELSDVLQRMDDVLLEKRESGLYLRRDVHSFHDDGVYLAKRNQRRLWSQSAALRDADEIYADVMSAWGNA
jgi:hypothetical protein